MRTSRISIVVALLVITGCAKETPHDVRQTNTVVLPQLGVSFDMTPQEAKAALTRQGAVFTEIQATERDPYQLRCRKSGFTLLDEGLLELNYVFWQNRLSQLFVYRVGDDTSAIAPLVDVFRLTKSGHGRWSGLDGRVEVRLKSGDSEKMLFSIVASEEKGTSNKRIQPTR